MPGFVIKDFGGEVPRRNDRLLPNDMATQSVNCDLSSGALQGLPQPQFIIDLTSQAPWPIRKAYRIPGPPPANPGDPPNPDVWMPLPSEFSSVCPSPLTNDTLNRYYWTNPPGQPMAGAWWNTYDRIAAGNTGSNAPYNMGFIGPDLTAVLTVSASGGTDPGTLPYITRSYVFTYVDIYGMESSPCNPSDPVDGASDGTWTVSGIPAAPPPNPPGLTYAPVDHMRLYRTVTGSTTGANFFYVDDIPLGTTTYVDTIPDTIVANNNTLTTASFYPPLPNMDGLILFPGGMMMGFTGNTVHFCEPDLPHAWPIGYDTSVYYPIMGLAIWQSTLVVLTKGYPSNGSGTTPSSFYFSQINVPEPCLSRGSIITDLAGVYYASQNGLVMLNYFGMQNQTLSNMTKNIWLEEYQAANIVACRHRSQYLALNGTGMGFIIDYTESRMGVMHITPVINAVSVWNDVYTGDAYMMADGKVWLWDSPNAQPLIYRWRSKENYLPAPASLGACQISLDPMVENPPPPIIPGTPGPPIPPAGLDLPAGVNALFNLYAGPNGLHKVMTRNLVKSREIFRLPSGFKAFDWQCEIIADVPVYSIELATTMRELKKV